MYEVRYKAAHPTYELAPIGAARGSHSVCISAVTMSQLEEEIGMWFVEPAVPRPFKDINTNIFETVPPSWKLEDSQQGLIQEWIKRIME